MIMRHLNPKSLASGRRTEITGLCQSETGSWMAPLGLTRWEAGGRPPWQPLRRRLPNCRIGRPTNVHRARQAEDTGGDRSRPRWRHRRHPAPGGSVLVGLERMAPAARRRRARCKDVGQTRAQARATRWRRNWRGPNRRMRLLRRLEHAEAIIAIQKTIAALLGLPLATSDSDNAS
jgi:hypothetical protein